MVTRMIIYIIVGSLSFGCASSEVKKMNNEIPLNIKNKISHEFNIVLNPSDSDYDKCLLNIKSQLSKLENFTSIKRITKRTHLVVFSTVTTATEIANHLKESSCLKYVSKNEIYKKH